VLWRHGRTEWNATGRFQGRLDSPLEPGGLADVERAAAVLAALPPVAVVSSTAGRAVATAAYLESVTGLRAALDADLQEMDLGAWQGLSLAEAQARFPEEHSAWVAGVDVARGGGETYTQLGARASRALLRALSDVPPGGALVAVAHGGTIRASIGSLLSLPVTTWWRIAPLGNARWSVLVEGPRGWRLAEHNAGVTEPADRSRFSAPDVEPGDEGLAARADI
jgi:probable phosphoglycerate mutase